MPNLGTDASLLRASYHEPDAVLFLLDLNLLLEALRQLYSRTDFSLSFIHGDKLTSKVKKLQRSIGVRSCSD